MAERSERTPVILYDCPEKSDQLNKALSCNQVLALQRGASAESVNTTVRELLRLKPQHLPKGAEKRRAPRLRTAIEIRLRGPVTHHLKTYDLSALGAFVACERPDPVGTEYETTVYVPHLDPPIMVMSRVIHVRKRAIGDLPAGMGLSFQPRDSEERTRLFAALRSPTPMSG